MAAVGPRSVHTHCICHLLGVPFEPSGPSSPLKPPLQSPERGKGSAPGQSCSDGGQLARCQWGRARRGRGGGHFDVVGSILPRVDSAERPADVIVEYDGLTPLPTDVNKLPCSHKAGRDRACEWRLIFAAELQACTLRRCAAPLRPRLLTDRLADHCKKESILHLVLLAAPKSPPGGG